MQTATLAAHILTTPFDRFDAQDIDCAKLRLIDMLGCIIGGNRAPGTAALVDLVAGWGGAGGVTVPGQRLRLPAPQAAFLSSLLGRAFDFEVTGPEAEGAHAGKMVGHVPSTTEPAALALGQGVSGRELLAAVILGGDVAARFAVANTFDFDRNFEVCGTANAFGALAVAARLMRLDAAQTVNAFGILLHMVGGSFQSLWDGVDAFRLPGALAAQNGILAAQMSRAGFGGVRQPLTAPQGYFALFGNAPQPENLLTDLGKLFYVKGMHKLHPSCYGNHNPIESALDIVRQRKFSAAQVVDVTLEVPARRIRHFLNQPMRATDAQPRALFSIPYGVANVLLRKSVELEHYIAPAIHDPAVMALSEKVRLVASDRVSGTHQGVLTVTLADGSTISAERSLPKGWAENPVGRPEVEAKFWRNIAFAGTVAHAQAERALEMIDRLETPGDAGALVEVLAG